MKAIWNRTTNRYEIEMSATEQGIIKAALGLSGDSTGDKSFYEVRTAFTIALETAKEKD